MNCDDYRNRYAVFTSFPLARELSESDEYEFWHTHGFECSLCQTWNLEQEVIKRGHNISDYPCIHIAYYSTMKCSEHQDAKECPDVTIVKVDNEYGMPVRDGGKSYIKIEYCPWCGIKL
jgi:hypothetical protein